jgi:hypothetical protein
MISPQIEYRKAKTRVKKYGKILYIPFENTSERFVIRKISENILIKKQCENAWKVSTIGTTKWTSSAFGSFNSIVVEQEMLQGDLNLPPAVDH